ncbi:ATP-binding protein [Phenylobacterium sp.]|jgi:C4-dicarboxylate-specific signal transduction histidine kinase|uniref:ATP-binding protein n=1 Tax=Phenylobacterium sp. TaxID=1871053 RepID=UPI002E2FE9BF|nr:ATP-binding protein [Phenylobacterium sp.]HEX4709541.1 ATP-binding protein [Phenylobacterium sp.]
MLQRYGLAILCCGVALAVAWPIDAPASCFLLAVTVSSLVGGLGPGLLCAALSALAFDVLFLNRLLQPAFLPTDGLRVVVFLATALLVAGLLEVKRRAEEAGKRAEEDLREARDDLAQLSRMTAMGELTAFIAHEVNQPIAASVTNANACLRWLAGDPPNLEEARDATRSIVEAGTRASEIISRTRQFFKTGMPQRELVDMAEIIDGTIVLLTSEATRYAITIRTSLASGLPKFIADRVQLQQVMVNLITNSIDAMKDVAGARELVISSERTADREILVSVSDTGVGLPPKPTVQIFDAFVSTKRNGTGLGLAISRSIVQAHGGRLWATPNTPRGAVFQFTLAIEDEPLDQQL